jgi:tyrosyl-tRNA synthetase
MHPSGHLHFGSCRCINPSIVADLSCLVVAPADKLSAFKFYQHLLTNVADVEAGKFLRMLTFLPLEDIAQIEAESQQQV